MEEVTPELIFKKLNEERISGEIKLLNEDFYTKVRMCIEKLSRDRSTANETENARRMFSSLVEKRKQKLLLYLAYNKPLPKPIPREEEDLYTEMQKILSSETSETKITKIKVMAELPEIVTPYGKKLGPYKSGDVLEIYDDKDAVFLLNNKIGEKV